MFRALLALFLTVLPGTLPAQSERSGDYDDFGAYSFEIRTLPPPEGASPGTAAWRDPGLRVAQAIRDATAFCGGLPDRTYRIDCLSERLEFVARAMPNNGPYRDSRRAIETASRKLKALASRYADPGKARNAYAARGPRPQATTRPLTAIRQADMAAANRQATAIIAEAETVLLRSSDTQPAQEVQIRQIAAAVGSNKVLLRST